MNRIILTVLIAILPIISYAQEFRQVNLTEQNEIIDRINSTVASVETIKSNFIQIKRMSLMQEDMQSFGQLYYSSKGMLRWEYLKPYTYCFILKGDNVSIKSHKSTDQINIKNNKIFQEITKIMMNSITGKCLSDAQGFDVKMSVGNKVLIADLIPKKKELKRMFKNIKLYFDSEKMMIVKIEMFERNSDLTTINLNDIEINKVIDEAVFTTN